MWPLQDSKHVTTTGQQALKHEKVQQREAACWWKLTTDGHTLIYNSKKLTATTENIDQLQSQLQQVEQKLAALQAAMANQLQPPTEPQLW